MLVSALQLASDTDLDGNVRRASELFAIAAGRGAELIVLPEKWSLLGDPDVLRARAEPLDGRAITAIRELCRSHRVHCVAGSIAERIDGQAKLGNTSVVINDSGEIIAHYRKLHMFDVTLDGVAYRESDAEKAGDLVVTVDVPGVRLGLSICYDLRFPELYRLLALNGAQIVTVPSAFTLHTGRDHWEVLLRARAIENQCFVVAANIIGDHGAGKASYGRSMIVDPWGIVLAQAADIETAIVADIDLGAIDRVKLAMPVMEHRRTDLY